MLPSSPNFFLFPFLFSFSFSSSSTSSFSFFFFLLLSFSFFPVLFFFLFYFPCPRFLSLPLPFSIFLFLFFLYHLSPTLLLLTAQLPFLPQNPSAKEKSHSIVFDNDVIERCPFTTELSGCQFSPRITGQWTPRRATGDVRQQ